MAPLARAWLAEPARVSGLVVDAGTAEAVPRARVRVWRLASPELLYHPVDAEAVAVAVGVSDRAGRFLLPYLGDGGYGVEVRAMNYAALRFWLPLDGAELDLGVLRLSPGAVVRGFVYGAGRRPLAGCTVYLMPGQEGGPPLSWSTHTRGDGSFAFSNVPAGVYQLEASRCVRSGAGRGSRRTWPVPVRCEAGGAARQNLFFERP